MENIVEQIRQVLRENVDEKTKGNAQSFFKEKIKFYGVRVNIVTKISKEIFKEIEGYSKEDILVICEKLWESGYTEESYIAANLAYYIHDRYEPKDFEVFERWVKKYVNNWGSCDTLCNHAIGTFVEMYSEYVGNLKKWAKSENRWMRRAAAVTLIIPARKGLFLEDIFEISDTLLLDTDDLVQKGYAWMLKAASESHLKEVYDYVISKKKIMPRTAYRYALEKMPSELRKEAMRKG